MKKNSFVLLTTVVLIFVFSILIIDIFETKNLNSTNITNQYRYIQAKNHLEFLTTYINSLEDLKLTDKISIEDKNFEIYANIRKKTLEYEIDIYVKNTNFNISLHKKIFKD